MNNNKIVTALVSIIVALTTILAVFIANALIPDGTREAMSLAMRNRQDIEVIKKELQIEISTIKSDIADIKQMLRKK